jgi:thioredoxin 1
MTPRTIITWTLVGLLAAGTGWVMSAVDRAAPQASSAGVGAGAGDAVQQALRSGKPTVVEFGANNCTSCREMKPVLARLAREQGDHIGVVDIDLLKTTGYVGAYKIQLMPTQVFFDAQGRETSRHMGKISAQEILARLGRPAP